MGMSEQPTGGAGDALAEEGGEEQLIQIEEGAAGMIEEVSTPEMNKQGSSSSGGADVAPDKHPEKRRQAAYMKFEEERLPEMKIEFPGLKLSQYKEKLFKEVRNIRNSLTFNLQWKKSPLNPMNQQDQ